MQDNCRNLPLLCRPRTPTKSILRDNFTSSKIIYWTTTLFIFLFDGVMPALTSNTELAKQGISHLGYPDYFRTMFTVCKVIGSIGLLLPFVKGWVKEWIYAGFAFDFIFAAASHWVVDGFGSEVIFPLIVLAVLIVSYITYHKLQSSNAYVKKKAIAGNQSIVLQ